MEGDVTTENESDLSDWDPVNAALTSEYSEDSDEYGIYYGDTQMYDTPIGGSSDRFSGSTNQGVSGGQDKYASRQMRKMISQLNSSHGDSAYSGSGSLYPIHEFETDSGTDVEDNDNEEENIPTSMAPRDAPVYGRYQKFSSHLGDRDIDARSPQNDILDQLVLHRLPGENLGMILGIEGGKDMTGKVSSVAVKSVTLGGAAYRATGSSKGLCVGDEIIEVNGLNLQTLTHDECVQMFKDMPLRVRLGIRRGQKDLPPVSISPGPTYNQQLLVPKKVMRPGRNEPVQITRRRDASDSEDDLFGGFAVYHVTINKDPEQNLGISIVPSYGSTKEYYQIKRVLPSGAAAQTGQLEVGDRLISCNGTSLKALTQNHCLEVIKAASSCGDIKFEVIRPVYHGNSMEISVTLNNGVNNSAYDPSQYSVKSQSYDNQNIDVVVTSESDDYLTVSDDEVARNNRLANIPEVEVNEVFATNSVRLAFQQDNPIEDESTETESDIAHVNQIDYPAEGIDIVDLNISDISPYHLPKRTESLSSGDAPGFTFDAYRLQPATTSNPIYAPSDNESDQIVPDEEPLSDTNIPYSEIDQVSPRSLIPCSDLDQVSPRSQIPSSNIDQIRPHSPIQSSHLDHLHLQRTSPQNHSQQSSVPQSELDYHSSNSPIPNIDLDSISVDSSYAKRQQVPSDIDVPVSYNYPPSYVGDSIPVSDTEDTRYNPLYEDSNLSEFTDSEPHDLYIQSSHNLDDIPSADLDRISIASNRTLTRTDLDAISVGSDWKVEAEGTENGESELSVPPPFEFSDETVTDPNKEIIDQNTVDNIFQELVSDIETNNSNLDREQIDNPCFEEEITSFSSYSVPRNSQQFHEQFNEDSVSESDEEIDDSSREPDTEESDIDEAKLAFSTELGAPFDIVLQEQDLKLASEPQIIESYDEADEDILNQVTSYDDGTVVISQFEPELKEGINDKHSTAIQSPEPEIVIPKYRFTRQVNTKPQEGMDHQSESMLKDALDMEYETMNDSSKSEARLKLSAHHDGINTNNNTDDLNGFDDPNFENKNIVAEGIAQEMAKAENGGVGYFVESDDEPDQYPDADVPEGAPDLPDLPPPVMGGDLNLVSISVNGQAMDVTDDDDVELSESSENMPEAEAVMDDNWSFKTKAAKHDIEPDLNDDDENIVPTKIQRKVDIPVKFVQEESKEEEIVMPESIRRVFQLPEHFKERAPSPKQEVDMELDFNGPVVNVSSKTAEPKRHVTNLAIDNDSSGDEVEEEAIQPLEVKKDHAKNLVNVISVVNALKAGSKDKDPDEVDKIEREDTKSKPKSFQSAMIKIGGLGKSDASQVSPPKHEQVESMKDTITVTNKFKDKISTKENIPEEANSEKKSGTVVKSEMPVLKTSISVENTKQEDPMSTNKVELVVQSTKQTVPPLNLNYLNGQESPRSDTSVSPTSSYKTTIGVTKPESPSNKTIVTVKKADQPKTEPKESKDKDLASSSSSQLSGTAPLSKSLSQIKPLSFNPKSLSAIGSRPIQYKTTISTLGSKPGSLSSISKPLAGSVKPDHPIKRMETMPFEVSILKGILGIGIKTTMTPEGWVQVTEILPNGPVGREGNIKVGDYILAINSTQLTGLTDGKVQQILRLLPRGLSKIVASAIPPDQVATSGSVSVEKPLLAARQSLPPSSGLSKPQLSPRQSSPLSSPRSGTTQKPAGPQVTPSLSPGRHQPSSTSQPTKSDPPTPAARVVKTESNTAAPVLPKSMPPIAAPRSIHISIGPKSPNLLAQTPPSLSPRSPKSPVSPTSRSVHPPVAPKPVRQVTSPTSTTASVSQLHSQNHKSPRSPPPVAPKPQRSTASTSQPQNPNAPMEAQIFASVTSSQKATPSGPNILPGSVNYDSLQNSNKTGWVPGVVSSADIKSGKEDVVCDTDTQTVHVHHTVDTVNVVEDAPPHVSSPDNDLHSKDLTNESEKDIAEKPTSAIEAAVGSVGNTNNESKVTAEVDSDLNSVLEKFSEVEKDAEEEPEGVLLNRSRTFSTSSNASSYTEFTECDVQDEIPEKIAEEEEDSPGKIDLKSLEQENYESDFEEEDDKECESKQESDKIRNLAETIVSNVMSSVINSDLLVNASEAKLEDQDAANDDVPALPVSPPPVSDIDQNVNESVPEDSPPPLPAKLDLDTPATVVDLALYPDSDQETIDKQTNKAGGVEVNEAEVLDVVNVSVTNNLHAEAPPVIDLVMHNNSDNEQDDSCIPQAGGDSELQEDKSAVLDVQNGVDCVQNEASVEDQSISNVISMYSNLDQPLTIDNGNDTTETNNNYFKSDGEALRKSVEFDFEKRQFRNEADDIASNISIAGSEANVADSIFDGASSGFPSRTASVDDLENEFCENKSVISVESEPVNGVSVPDYQKDIDVFHSDNEICEREKQRRLPVVSEVDSKTNTQVEDQPDSAHVPQLSSRSSEERSPNQTDKGTRSGESDEANREVASSRPKSVSRVDELIHQMDEARKYSPEIHQMIRMMSAETEDPAPTGEGDVIEMTLNKGVTGLGFLIQGGRFTPKGDMPLTIKRIFKGGPADGFLQVGDEICQVNGEDMSNMRHSEAWNHLKFLPSGDITMTIRRYKD